MWAVYSAPTSVLMHTVELVARGIEEKMGLTFAYMPPRPYTRLAEYRLQICRAAIGGQMSYQSVSGPPRQSCTCGQCGHPCYPMWVACVQRCVGAVCRQPRSIMPPAPQPRRIFSDLTRGRRLGTMQVVFTRCRSQDRRVDYTSSRRRRLDVAATYGRAPVLWYGSWMHDAMACQQSGGFGHVTAATLTATARRKNEHGSGRARWSSSVLRRSRCERENKARYGQACIGQ